MQHWRFQTQNCKGSWKYLFTQNQSLITYYKHMFYLLSSWINVNGTSHLKSLVNIRIIQQNMDAMVDINYMFINFLIWAFNYAFEITLQFYFFLKSHILNGFFFFMQTFAFSFNKTFQLSTLTFILIVIMLLDLFQPY